MVKICKYASVLKAVCFCTPCMYNWFPWDSKTFPSTLSHAEEIYIGFTHRQTFLSFFLLIALPASKAVQCSLGGGKVIT